MTRRAQRRCTATLVVLAAGAAAGCSAPPPHAASLTIRILNAAAGADEPTACPVHLTALGDSGPGVTTATVASCRGDDGAPGRLRVELAPGKYRVQVGQYGCGMGGSCPRDPDASAYGPRALAVWTCSTSVTLRRDGRATLTADNDHRQGRTNVVVCTT